jgi:MFS family permease
MSTAAIAEGIEKGETRIWNSLFIKVFIIDILAQYGIYTMNVLTPPYADHLGAAPTIVGLVSSLFALTALIFKVISAPAIDTFNRKIVLIVALFILLVSFTGYSFSTNIPMLGISRLLTGVALAFIPTCCITIASDSLPSDKISTGIGIYALGTALCQAVAPAVGLRMVNLTGYNITFAMLAVLMVLTIAYAGTMKTSFVRTKKFKISPTNIIAKEVLVPTSILYLLNMTFCIVNAFLVLFGLQQGVDSNHIGYFFTVLAVTLIFSRPLIGKLADEYGSVKVILGSMCCFIASFLVISYSRTFSMFLLAGFISAFGYAGCHPALMAVCMRSVPKERRGAASCTSYIGQDIGNLTGPVLAGAIAERLGYASMWRIMIFPIFIAMLIAILFRHQIDHARQKVAVTNAAG